MKFALGGALEGRALRKIEALAGKTVVLPCHINASDEVPTVEWSKKGLESSDDIIAFLYRDGCETHDEKNQAFLYRTNLFMDKLNSGNISLMISNVQLSDTGTYICTVRGKTSQEVATWELAVAVDDGVTLQCETDCSFPKPEIAFLDVEGNDISIEDPKTQVSDGCFTVSRRLTLQTHSKRITCRVWHPKKGPVKVTTTDNHYPAECTGSIIIAVAAASIVVCGLTVLICKKCGSCAGGLKTPLSRQSSDQSITCSSAEIPPQIIQVDNFKNATEEHQRITNDLKSKLHEKDEIIRQLTEQLNDLRSKQSPVVCQHGQPTLVSSPSKPSPDVSKPPTLPPQHVLHNNTPKPEASTSSSPLKTASLPLRKDLKPGAQRQSPAPLPLIQGSSYNYSSPALLMDFSSPSSPSAGAPPQSTVSRSQSLSESRSRPNGARRERRHTTLIPVSNRYGVLGDLPEDFEPLLH
ncbi:uncharacterized protein LOC143316693 isoform X2 [Chaetodon auriga]|uniref:uncharacterized protein LOC143316693 isoform X2 n=1 Tax=Chaetodon auriga TaxID=39042 RepID=UPI004032F4B1